MNELPADAPENAGPLTIHYDGAGKQFDDRWIVKGLDVKVEAGTILGMVGPSGCGKTTAVRLATGVYRPDEGRVTVLGEEPAERPTAMRTAIVYRPQAPVLFDDLSLRENLNFHASLNGVRWRRRGRVREVLELVSLTGEERKLVRDSPPDLGPLPPPARPRSNRHRDNSARRRSGTLRRRRRAR